MKLSRSLIACLFVCWVGNGWIDKWSFWFSPERMVLAPHWGWMTNYNQDGQGHICASFYSTGRSEILRAPLELMWDVSKWWKRWWRRKKKKKKGEKGKPLLQDVSTCSPPCCSAVAGNLLLLASPLHQVIWPFNTSHVYCSFITFICITY